MQWSPTACFTFQISRTLVNVMGECFADDFDQGCGERYEIEINKMGQNIPSPVTTRTHTHTQMCAQTHFKLMCEYWLCRAELPHGKSLQRPILGTWHYCC